MPIRFADTARPNNSTTPTGKGTFPVAKADDVWFNDGDSLEEKWRDMTGEAQTIQQDEMPEASLDEYGNIYQYVGDTNENFINGYFYQCKADTDETTGDVIYKWVEKSVSPSLQVSQEEGNIIEEKEDGIYAKSWVKKVETVPMGTDIEDVMYRSSIAEPNIVVYNDTDLMEVVQYLKDQGFTEEIHDGPSHHVYYMYPPADSLMEFRIELGSLLQDWDTIHHFNISIPKENTAESDRRPQINVYRTAVLGSYSGQLSSMADGVSWNCWIRDLNNLTNDYLYIGDSDSQTVKRIPLFNQIPDSVKVSKEENNQIEVLDDGLYVSESISGGIDCIAVEDITIATDLEFGKYYYDCTEDKVYVKKEDGPEVVEAAPTHIDITKELYDILTEDQKKKDVVWFISDMENEFDKVDVTSATVQELLKNHTDAKPTAGSINYVASGGVYNSIQDVFDAIAALRSSFYPRTEGYWLLQNNVGTLVSDKTFTANHDGLLKVHFVKRYSGNTIQLRINENVVDSIPNYGGDLINETLSGVLEGYVHNGDSIRITCDGNGSNWYIQNVIIQKINWFTT